MQPAAWTRSVERGAYAKHLRVQQDVSRELRAILRSAADEASSLVMASVDPRVGAAVQRAQLQAVSQELARMSGHLWTSVGEATARGANAGMLVATEGHEQLVYRLAQVSGNEALARSLGVAARRSAENVRGKLLNNIQLSGPVYRNNANTVRHVNRIVARGIAMNSSAQQIATAVRGYITPNTPGGARYASMRLARTEINNAFHAVNTEMYNTSPFIEGVKWERSASHGVPDECDDYTDGDHDNLGPGVFKPGNVPDKPHPNCLCFTVAITIPPQQFLRGLASGAYDSL
jgi:hypothetical protein